MRKAPNTNKLKYVGAALLEGESVTLIQAARLVLEIKEALGDEICTITRCREVVSLGLNAIKNKHHTVSFGTAAVECLRSKSHRRPRTLTDIRSIIHKLKKSNPELEHTPLRNLSVEECQSILMNTFTTSRQRHKARLILSGIFSFSVKRGWCDENPILRVDTPFLREQEIPALTLKEVTQLLKACMDEFDGSCVAGAALMIFAGIRPQEVERLLWENIAIRDGCVILNSKHTKTGGARHVTILPVLAKWLKFCRDKSKPGPGTPICPKGWTIKWRKIRKKAGWGGRKKSWVPDCLRHTYASYHAKHFKDYNLLQMEMGHRSSSLLRTRVPEHERHFPANGHALLGADAGQGHCGDGTAGRTAGGLMGKEKNALERKALFPAGAWKKGRFLQLVIGISVQAGTEHFQSPPAF